MSAERLSVRVRAAAAGRERWPAAADLGTLFVVNLLLVIGLWWRDGGATSLSATSLGRLTGLVGTYLVLVQLLLVRASRHSSGGSASTG